jgi:hypothetical protein
MGRRFKIKGRHVIDTAEQARAKYLDARRIKGSAYVVTDVLYRAPFPQNSADLRAAADKAFVAELEQSIEEPESK